MAADPAGVVIGVDIGTTSTKSVAYDRRGHVLASCSVGYALHEPSPGYAEQDPDEIVEAALATLGAVVGQLASPVAGLCFSTAMHSLTGLDADGRPLTPLLTWADSRAAEHAERIRAGAGGRALHRRTGTPVHPMAPLAKLAWFSDHEPELSRRVAHWVGIKDYVLLHVCDELVMDASTASATGLLDLSSMAWDPEALALAKVTADKLPRLVATTRVLRSLTTRATDATGLSADTPVVVGAGDGPLANLGVGAVGPGVAACSIGTSGALRVLVASPAVDESGGIFCYALTPNHWVVGGAISNGGVVLDWMSDSLAPDLAVEELLELAASVPAGCGGLVMLPYLLSERAPHWSTVPRGAYIGLTREHRREHLIRAALEGVCLQLALVLRSMRAAGIEVHEVRATGGFAQSGLWRQMLADALGLPISFPAGHQGSSLGAALLGMRALGLVESLDVAADLVAIDQVVHPEPLAADRYASLLPVFADLYEVLLPAYRALRELRPGMPLDTGAG